jgi:thioredoxin-dependent peroxiredoxin
MSLQPVDFWGHTGENFRFNRKNHISSKGERPTLSQALRVTIMSQASAGRATGTQVGNLAPDFEVKDGNGNSWRLSDHRGRVVALVFYPKDETAVCTKQMCSIRDHWDDYKATGAEVVGVSVDTVESHRKFAEHHNLPQTLLADANKEVTTQLNVKSILGGSQRAVIVIDKDGVIAYRKSVVPIFRPTDDEVISAIKSAQAR